LLVDGVAAVGRDADDDFLGAIALLLGVGRQVSCSSVNLL
jgi:hypothetical protein